MSAHVGVFHNEPRPPPDDPAVLKEVAARLLTARRGARTAAELRTADRRWVYGADGRIDRVKYEAFAGEVSVFNFEGGVSMKKNVPLRLVYLKTGGPVPDEKLGEFLKTSGFNVTRTVDRILVFCCMQLTPGLDTVDVRVTQQLCMDVFYVLPSDHVDPVFSVSHLASPTMVRDASAAQVWEYIRKISSPERPTVLVYNSNIPLLAQLLQPPADFGACLVFNHALALGWFYASERSGMQHYTAISGRKPPEDPLCAWCYSLQQFPFADAIVLGHLSTRAS